MCEYIHADMSKFAVLILAHGRPELSGTFDKLRSCGYTGRIVFVTDNEDSKAHGYINKYGTENVFVFNKLKCLRKKQFFKNPSLMPSLPLI